MSKGHDQFKRGSRGRRVPIPGHGQALVGNVTCVTHRKKAYPSRKDAKVVAKLMRTRYKDSNIEPYPCDVMDGMWHLGHDSYRGPAGERTFNR